MTEHKTHRIDGRRVTCGEHRFVNKRTGELLTCACGHPASHKVGQEFISPATGARITFRRYVCPCCHAKACREAEHWKAHQYRWSFTP